VYDFLGHVNVFHGRVKDGQAQIGPHDASHPDGTAKEGEAAKVYVRPHLLEISHEAGAPGSFRARVLHVNPAGPIVRVELLSEWSQPVQVDLTQERYRELKLARDAEVYVTPKELKVYAEDYSI
jgi:sulfate transport system ATP-binding protein